MIVRDLDAFAVACRRVGLEFVPDRRSFRWSEVGPALPFPLPCAAGYVFGSCDHVARIPDDDQANEIGLIRSADGDGFRLVFDRFAAGYGLEAVAGQRCERLLQAYQSAIDGNNLSG